VVVKHDGENEYLHCPECGMRPVKKLKEDDGSEELGEEAGSFLSLADLSKRHWNCLGCGEPLWTYTHELDRFEPAKFIHKKMQGFFDYLVVDELHEEKSAESAQANAVGSLAAACKKAVCLTGTLIGGYAEHLRPLLFRFSPNSLVRMGYEWHQAMPFNECYGRIETKITERKGGDDANKQSRGSSRSKTKYVRPGIMPTIFGHHLMDKAVFLGLEEVAANLPPFAEFVTGCPMDADMEKEYAGIQDALESAIKEMVRRGDKRLLGPMLNVLLCYPDHPHGWKEVGYFAPKLDGEKQWIGVVQPNDLDAKKLRPKEQKLIEIIEEERRQGRQVWVYNVMSGEEKDVNQRLAGLLKIRGIKTDILRASVPLAKREEWIAKHGPKADVILSHPRLVETGLDLFDKNGGHNFPTLIFYSTGYNLFTLRQASRRAWRIGQRLPCKVHYLFYQGTMQDRAIALMGRKMSAAKAIEGKFSSDGLVAMAGEEGMEMALAKSLADRIDEGEAVRHWTRVGVADTRTGHDMALDDFVADLQQLLAEIEGDSSFLSDDAAPEDFPLLAAS
jgi:hypothetical protein